MQFATRRGGSPEESERGTGGAWRRSMLPDVKPAAGLVLLIVGALAISSQLQRPAPASDDERRVQYEINWKNFSANCRNADAGPSHVLENFCRQSAALLTELPECDGGCQEAISFYKKAP